MTIVNIPELSPPREEFIDLGPDFDVEWVRLSGLPRNWLERRIRRPRLSRYRGAVEAVLASRRASRPLIVSHLPTMSAAVATFAAAMGSRARHLAFSFNFTTLPVGRRRAYFERALRGIDAFVVYSAYERTRYAEYFDIPVERFRTVIWTQGPPPVAATRPAVFDRPYLCAVGAEGRDFASLLAAARETNLPLVVIAHPYGLAGMEVPENVRMFSDLPIADTWAIAAASRGVLVPLLDSKTACGHITIVSAKMLGLPLITTQSLALAEYVGDHAVALTSAAHDVAGLAHNMRELYENSDRYAGEAQALVEANRRKHARTLWAQFLASFIDEQRWNS